MSVFPVVTADSAPLWDGYRDGEVRLPWCVACGRPHLPPGPCCPFCLDDRLNWRPASGQGLIGTFAVFHRRYLDDFPPPYIFVQVELDEGPRLPGSMPLDTRHLLKVGLRVAAHFAPAANGWTLPFFLPL